MGFIQGEIFVKTYMMILLSILCRNIIFSVLQLDLSGSCIEKKLPLVMFTLSFSMSRKLQMGCIGNNSILDLMKRYL